MVFTIKTYSQAIIPDLYYIYPFSIKLDLFGTHFFSNVCLKLAKSLTISPFVPLRVGHTLTKGRFFFYINGNLIWESEFRSHYVGRLKFFKTFRVYDAHDMWNDFKDSEVRKAKHSWRETASDVCMLLVCSCEKNISRRNNYLLDVSRLYFNLSVRPSLCLCFVLVPSLFPSSLTITSSLIFSLSSPSFSLSCPLFLK